MAQDDRRIHHRYEVTRLAASSHTLLEQAHSAAVIASSGSPDPTAFAHRAPASSRIRLAASDLAQEPDIWRRDPTGSGASVRERAVGTWRPAGAVRIVGLITHRGCEPHPISEQEVA